MSFFDPVPEPKSVLGYHRILSSTAGVRVSPLCLGSMNFGDAWQSFMGKCDKKTTFEILDYFYEQGGNFIDTANNYQNEESESWIGEWAEQRGVRDQLVIATKYTMGYRGYKREKEPLQSNYTGNHAKSLRHSVEDSLRKLKTSYVDVLYLHWWDFSTGVEEVMQSLNTLVQQGKVIYLGISDTPAWIVSKANQYARDHGLRPFVVYQGRWSAADRDMEREIIPMARAEGMAIAPWNALGGGKFRTAAQYKEAEMSEEGRKFGPASEKEKAVSGVLEKLAGEKGSSIHGVALAYVMHKAPNVFPIVGGRNKKHLESNIEALKLKLTAEDVAAIEGAAEFDYGFPLNFLFMGQEMTGRTQENMLTRIVARIDSLPNQQPVPPRSS